MQYLAKKRIILFVLCNKHFDFVSLWQSLRNVNVQLLFVCLLLTSIPPAPWLPFTHAASSMLHLSLISLPGHNYVYEPTCHTPWFGRQHKKVIREPLAPHWNDNWPLDSISRPPCGFDTDQTPHPHTHTHTFTLVVMFDHHNLYTQICVCTHICMIDDNDLFVPTINMSFKLHVG